VVGGSLREAYGNAEGTRALIEVLLLHRHTEHRHVVAGITAALQAGALTADAVAVEARKAADTAAGVATAVDRAASPDTTSVSSLTQRRLTHLPVDTRPPPSVTAYDQLLRRSTQ
jgi:hypothetical protein